MIALTQSTRLPRLRSLSLQSSGTTFHLLDTAAWANGLISLRLVNACPSPRMLRCVEAGKLESLALEDLTLSEPTSDDLASWRRLPHLHTLAITGCVAEGSIRPLLGVQTERLRSLSLTHSTFGAFAEHLPGAPLLARVEDLALTIDSMSALEAWQFANSPQSARIVRLRLLRTGIDGKAAAELLALPALRLLSLRETRLGPVNIEAFLARPELSKLVSLDLSHSRLQSEGIARVAASPHLANLLELDLSGAGHTDDSVVSLANSEHLTSLRRLRISGQFSKHSTAQALAKSAILANLVELNLSGCRFGERSRALLRERFGDALVM